MTTAASAVEGKIVVVLVKAAQTGVVLVVENWIGAMKEQVLVAMSGRGSR
jgi:hypothetical protein